MADEASLFFGEILKLQPMSSSSGHGKFFFLGILYINCLNLKGFVWF